MPQNSLVLVPRTVGLLLTVLSIQLVACHQLSVGIQSDMSKPTFGMHQPQSSHITYNNRDGINVQGALNDLLGPPIKIAQGFRNLFNGSTMAGAGQSLKTGGAVLGVDAKLLEAAGGVKLLKGGLLAGGADSKSNIAEAIAGTPGRKIASIVEVPVRVIAMKDLLAGNTLVEMGKSRSSQAEQAEAKGDRMIHEGNTLRAQGINQILQGATQGLQNIGSAVQQSTGNAATALKLLPIMMDLHRSQPQQPQQQQQQQIEQRNDLQQQEQKGQQHVDQSQHGRQSGLTGGSLFGGLNSLFTGGGASGGADSLGSGEAHQRPSLSNLFGGSNQQHHYAAVLNATNPLTSLLMNPNMNPFLLPINEAMDPMSNPMANSLTHAFGGGSGHTTQGGNMFGNGFGFGFGGGHNNNGANSQHLTQSFNLIPGLKISETISRGPAQLHQRLPEKTTTQGFEQQHLAAPTHQGPAEMAAPQQSPVVESAPSKDTTLIENAPTEKKQ